MEAHHLYNSYRLWWRKIQICVSCTYEGELKYMQTLVGKAEGGRDNLERLGVDGMIILKCLKEKNWKAWTGFFWLSFHKLRDISWLAEELPNGRSSSRETPGVTKVKIKNMILREMPPCSAIYREQRFDGICCLHLQNKCLKMEARSGSQKHIESNSVIRGAADKKCTQWNILPTEQSIDTRSVSL